MKFKPMATEAFNVFDIFIRNGVEMLQNKPTEIRDLFTVVHQHWNLDAQRLLQITIYNNQVYDKRDVKYQHPLSVEKLLLRFKNIYEVLGLFQTGNNSNEPNPLNIYDKVYHTIDDNRYFDQLEHVPYKPLHLLRVHDELIKNRKLFRHTHGLENREIVREDIQMLEQLPQNGLIQVILGRYSDTVVPKKI